MSSYTYPKDEENKLSSKGELVFQNMEITGTKTFVNGKHKYSMLVYHKDRLFPILLKIKEELLKQGYILLVKYSIDNAPGHADNLFWEVITNFLVHKIGL